MGLSVGIHQLASNPSKERNLLKILTKIERSDAYLDIFPEYMMGVRDEGIDREYIRSLAEPLNGPFISSIIGKSEELGKAVLFTTYLREANRIYNAAILAEKGRIKAVYRKMHLFDAYGYKESEIFSRGRDVAIAEIKGLKAGIAICFDLRFPELFRFMAYEGAELFLVPSAWFRGEYKLEQWYSLTTARAHENTAFLIAVDQVSKLFLGHSLIASPLGYIKINLGEEETSVTMGVSEDEIRKAREMVPTVRVARERHSVALS